MPEILLRSSHPILDGVRKHPGSSELFNLEQTDVQTLLENAKEPLAFDAPFPVAADIVLQHWRPQDLISISLQIPPEIVLRETGKDDDLLAQPGTETIEISPVEVSWQSSDVGLPLPDFSTRIDGDEASEQDDPNNQTSSAVVRFAESHVDKPPLPVLGDADKEVGNAETNATSGLAQVPASKRVVSEGSESADLVPEPLPHGPQPAHLAAQSTNGVFHEIVGQESNRPDSKPLPMHLAAPDQSMDLELELESHNQLQSKTANEEHANSRTENAAGSSAKHTIKYEPGDIRTPSLDPALPVVTNAAQHIQSDTELDSRPTETARESAIRLSWHPLVWTDSPELTQVATTVTPLVAAPLEVESGVPDRDSIAPRDASSNTQAMLGLIASPPLSTPGLGPATDELGKPGDAALVDLSGNPPSFASLTAVASLSSQTRMDPQIVPANIPEPVKQVAEAIAVRPNSPAGQIELTLTPEALGRVHFDMRHDATGLSVTLSAERSDTLEMMRRHLPELIAELRNAGIQTGNFSFGSWQEGRQAPVANLPKGDFTNPTPMPTSVVHATPKKRAVSGALDLRI